MLSVVVGSRWQRFCGLSVDDVCTVAEAAFDELGYEYRVEEIEPTRSEQMMLGANEPGT